MGDAHQAVQHNGGNDGGKNSSPPPRPTSSSVPDFPPSSLSSTDGQLEELVRKLEGLPSDRLKVVKELFLSVDDDPKQKKDKVLPKELVQPILDILPRLESVSMSDVGWPTGCFDLARFTFFSHLTSLTLVRCRVHVSWPHTFRILSRFTLDACHLDSGSVKSLFRLEQFPELDHLAIVGNNYTPFGSDLSDGEQKPFRFLLYRLRTFTVDLRNLHPTSGNSITLPFTSSFPRLLVDAQFKHLEASELSRCAGFPHHLRLYHAIFTSSARFEAACFNLDLNSVASKQLQTLILPAYFSPSRLSPPFSIGDTFDALLSICKTRNIPIIFEDRPKDVISPSFSKRAKGDSKPLTPKEKEALEERWADAMRRWKMKNEVELEEEKAVSSGTGGSSGSSANANKVGGKKT